MMAQCMRVDYLQQSMVKRCVAAGCSNTYKDGVSLFLFPKDPVIFKKWAQQVQRGRDKWKPSQHSVLCSCHFAPECYEPSTEVAKSLGLEMQKPRLKGDAVPTLPHETSFRRPKATSC